MMFEPTAQSLGGSSAPPRLDLDWADARRRIASAENYYICSVSTGGAPHVVPVLGLWLDTSIVFNTERTTRKHRHLIKNSAVAIAVTGPAYDFSIEGLAVPVTGQAALTAAASGFALKYDWWHPHVRHGEFHADDSPSPRTVFAVHPDTIFGFGKASGFSATRWSFTQSREAPSGCG